MAARQDRRSGLPEGGFAVPADERRPEGRELPAWLERSGERPLLEGDIVSIRQNARERDLQRRVDAWREKYLNYPAIVNVDTLTACQAHCHFCHHKTMKPNDRYGLAMTDELFAKIVDDLVPMPADLPLIFSPFWWNEPLLDEHILERMQHVVSVLPQATLYLTTNGERLTPDFLERLARIPRIGTLKVSLNWIDKDEYEQQMGISFDTVLANIRHAAEVQAREPFAAQLRIGRVREGYDDAKDRRFLEWVAEQLPGFEPVLFDDYPGIMELSDPRQRVFAACRHWFELNIAPDGRIGLCCVDSSVDFPLGNANSDNLLDVYNQQHLRFIRSSVQVRQELPFPCSNCNFDV